MKLSFSKIALPVCLALFCSCNNTIRNAADFKYEIVIGETLEIPSWYDLFESVSYIPLKTDNPMGNVNQIVVKNDLMYVLADGLYCFDMDGTCKFKNVNRGRARNEFLKASSLSVCDGKVFVYDRYKYRMLVFDAQNGDFIEDMDVPQFKTSVWFNGNSYISVDADPQDADYTLFKCYSKDDINTQTAAFFPKKEDVGVMFGTTTWTNDGLLCLSYIRNLAWKINGTDTVPYIKVTVPENRRVPDKIASAMIADGSRKVEDYMASGAICGLYYVTECEGFITGFVSDYGIGNTISVKFIYNKKTGKTCSFNVLEKMEPWQMLPVAERDYPSAGDANCIYSVRSSESLVLTKSILGIGNEPADSRFIEPFEVFKSAVDDGNPVVARFELK